MQNKARLCQVGIQECCYLKSKISHLSCPTAGAAQVKDSPLHAATLITANDGQVLAVVCYVSTHILAFAKL